VLSEKWTNIHQNPLGSAKHQYPSLCQISLHSAKTMFKSVTKFFYTIQYFGAPVGLLGRSSPISEICAPRKVDQSSPKSLKVCHTPMPLTVPNFIVLSQTVYEKALQKILHPSPFWCPRGSPRPTQQGPLYQSAKFHPFRQPVYRYLLLNFTDFVESMNDKPTKNKSSAVAEMGDHGHNRHGPKRGGLLCLFRR